MHWSYVFLALTHPVVTGTNKSRKVICSPDPTHQYAMLSPMPSDQHAAAFYSSQYMNIDGTTCHMSAVFRGIQCPGIVVNMPGLEKHRNSGNSVQSAYYGLTEHNHMWKMPSSNTFSRQNVFIASFLNCYAMAEKNEKDCLENTYYIDYTNTRLILVHMKCFVENLTFWSVILRSNTGYICHKWPIYH